MKLPRILLIDDEELVRLTLAQVLRNASFEVEVARDGAEGIKLFSERRADGVITDIIMPNREGIETIAELRKIDANVKIIAMSGGNRMGSMDFLVIARKLGADEVLKKPFVPKDIVYAASNILTAIDRGSIAGKAQARP